jgi:hypothetical protein
MNAYSIGYGSYEDSGRVELLHDAVFDDAALEAMVLDVLPEAARRHIDAERARHAELSDHVDDLEPFEPQAKFENIYSLVADLLVERHGFRKLDYAAQFSVFGWADLLVRGDWAGDGGGSDRQKAMTEALARAGLAVLSREEKDARDEASRAARAEARRNRRVRRAVARFEKDGTDPFSGVEDDADLAAAIVARLVGRPLTDAEAAVLSGALPDALAAVAERGFGAVQIGEMWAGRPGLEEVACTLRCLPALGAPAAPEQNPRT